MADELTELELVSTMQLQKILDSNKVAKAKIEAAAREEENAEAVLAHNTSNDSYEFVDAEGGDDFSLVSTQMLFKILAKDNIGKDPANDAGNDDKLDIPEMGGGGGFDPYNSN